MLKLCAFTEGGNYLHYPIVTVFPPLTLGQGEDYSFLSACKSLAAQHYWCTELNLSSTVTSPEYCGATACHPSLQRPSMYAFAKTKVILKNVFVHWQIPESTNI